MKPRCRLAVFTQVKHFKDCVPRNEARNWLDGFGHMAEQVYVIEPYLYTVLLANVKIQFRET